MAANERHAVTGAFGYSGKYIASRLLDMGHDVITLTNSANRHDPFGGRVMAIPFNFDQPNELVESLKDCTVLYNTYWVRFNHRNFTFADAIENSAILFDAAKQAGIKRIVHVSITNPSEDSPLEYFSGKAKVEKLLKQTDIEHTILRPAIIFGDEDILINNIAWSLRHLPAFITFGNGQYRVQPIYVDDLAKLAAEQGIATGNRTINAIGPETFTYRDLIKMIARALGKKRLIAPLPPAVAYLATSITGKLLGDIIVTREEIAGLMSNLLCVDSKPTGTTKFTDWVKANANILGKHYASELRRRKNRTCAYIPPKG